MRKATVRQARKEDIDAILLVEQEAWPMYAQASRAHFLSRIETFPEGTLVSVVGDTVVGVLSTQLVNYDINNPVATWNQVTDDGFIKRSHTPHGDTLYGVSLSVSRRGIGSVKLLFEAACALILQRGLRRCILGARIPRYHKFAHAMTIEEYIHTRKKSRLLDPELDLYTRVGFRIVVPLANYFRDPQSLDYGVLLTWDNPYYTDREQAAQRSSGLERTFSYVDEIYDYQVKRTVVRWVLLLPGTGCQWARESGGCYMCGFNKVIDEVLQGRVPTTFELNTLYRIGRDIVEHHQPELLTIYNAGSFLNDAEVPSSVQVNIFEDISLHPTVRKVLVETRPEYVTLEKVSILQSALRGKTLQVAIGLEVASDWVRKHCVNKGFSRRTFETAVKNLKRLEVEVLAYVLLKPPYLSEKEAIEEAIKSVEYSFNLGIDSVAVESVFVQEGTLVHRHFLDGHYRPPYLWSILEVVRNCHDLGPVFIGGFKDHPPPIAIPSNCGLCDAAIKEAFDIYNKTLDVASLSDVGCPCRREWEVELTKKYPPIEERLRKG
jgi:radical SAM enzyme (TIGR01210 family)